MLAHVARVKVKGFDSWEVFTGVADSLGSAKAQMNSIFRVASVTKMFTATLILQLWEEGLVDLDTPFNDYLVLDTVTYSKITLFKEKTSSYYLPDPVCRADGRLVTG